MSKVQSPAEIVVVARPEAALRATRGALDGAPAAKASSLSALLKSAKVELRPMFGATEDRVATWMSPQVNAAAPGGTDPALFYSVVGEVKNSKKLIESLLGEPAVEAAYYKPPGEPPEMQRERGAAPAGPALDLSPAATPDFSARQGYLDAAPGGIDARFAWTKPGGRGDNVRVIDLEWGWNFTHEDLLANSGGLLDGSNHSDTDHGTAVIGVIGGDHNGVGVIGIAANARLSAISFVGNSSAQAIRKAADALSAGDIMLLEIHRPGPRATGVGQMGFIAIEWWPDDFAAIRYATAKGILVVEAAGNGFQNLDDPIYSQRPAGFPASWTNPFNRNNPQCGAILVGAGAPPPGTHGQNHGADRSRLDFSNFGAAVDVQGWGREVTTTGRSWGVADLHNGGGNAWYTDQFSGTSSASPVVVGALACAQGWLRAGGKPLLTPASARTLLRNTGSPQQNEPGRPATQRIGNRPNLRAMHASLFPKLVIKDTKDNLKDLKEKERKEFIKERKELIKEVKEKERKELIKEKEIKEVKEFKEKDRKDMVERIDPVRVPADEGYEPGAGSADARIEALEAAVLGLMQMVQGSADALGQPFIDPGLRPDVAGATMQNLPPNPDENPGG